MSLPYFLGEVLFWGLFIWIVYKIGKAIFKKKKLLPKRDYKSLNK